MCPIEIIDVFLCRGLFAWDFAVFIDVFFQPVSQDVQHSLGGDEGAIGGEKDGNKGGVSHREGVEKV